MRRLVLLLCITGYVISQNLEANSTIFEKDNRNISQRLQDTFSLRGKSTPSGSGMPKLYVAIGFVFVIIILVVIAGVVVLICRCVRKFKGQTYRIPTNDQDPSTALTSTRPSVSGGAQREEEPREMQDLSTIDEGNESRVSSGYGPPAKETRATLYGTTKMSRSRTTEL
ncbi:hypothetical protein CAEBREN_20681 [Caenorhabditis brenneri]|uniref:Uncharacterized protein n=1 Tax=Caenorhabditis brenneri TaxID=135651 RepID=G0N140_CAEBE|nr:hypothetical protein CAEBREN_20681 [Caenorhabditis brenneri]